MNGEVPEIYWYLFWVGLAIVLGAATHLLLRNLLRGRFGRALPACAVAHGPCRPGPTCRPPALPIIRA
mgnify:CR=1 FL=1